MNSELYGAEDFMSWLSNIGFVFHEDRFSSEMNQCNWLAYRRSKIKARICEGNDDKERMLVVIKPYCYAHPNGSQALNQCEIEVTGKVNGIWYKLIAYTMDIRDLMSSSGKLDEIESSLISAWNAL